MNRGARCQFDAMAKTKIGKWLLALLPVFAAAEKVSAPGLKILRH